MEVVTAASGAFQDYWTRVHSYVMFNGFVQDILTYYYLVILNHYDMTDGLQ